MRLFVAVILVTVASASSASAQIGYGARAGVNFANVSFDGDDEVPSDGRIGALAGVFATVPLGGWLTVQPEAIYTVKGASVEVAEISSDYIVDYLEVPVLARFHLRSNIYLAAGPSMALRLRARSRTAFGGSTEELDLDDDVERFDLGVVGAIGVEFGRWLVDGRYTHGLSDTDADTSDAVKIRNRVFSISGGIRF